MVRRWGPSVSRGRNGQCGEGATTERRKAAPLLPQSKDGSPRRWPSVVHRLDAEAFQSAVEGGPVYVEDTGGFGHVSQAVG